MPRKWAVAIVITVFVLFTWTIWQVYTTLRSEPDVEQYNSYIGSITRQFDTKLIRSVYELQQKVLVPEEEITPDKTE